MNLVASASDYYKTIDFDIIPEGELNPQTGTGLFYSLDHLGSVRDVLNIQNGSVVASFD